MAEDESTETAENVQRPMTGDEKTAMLMHRFTRTTSTLGLVVGIVTANAIRTNADFAAHVGTSPLGQLSTAHRDLLRARGISDAVMDAQRCATVTAVDARWCREVGGFSHEQIAHAPFLVIPEYQGWTPGDPSVMHDEPVAYRIRYEPGRERVHAGKPAKQESAPGAANVISIPRAALPWARCQPWEVGITRPLGLVEGILNAMVLLSVQGDDPRMVPVAINGVRGAMQDGIELDALYALTPRDRAFYVCPDSDVMTNVNIYAATAKIVAFGRARKCATRVVLLPPPPGDAPKIGPDDWLVGSKQFTDIYAHTVGDLLALAMPDLPPRDEHDALLSYDDALLVPNVQQLVAGLLPVEGVTQISGKENTFKSFWALDVAACIAGGAADWHGHAISTAVHGPVLYIYAEGRTGYGQRLRAVTAFRDLKPKTPLYLLPTAINISDPAAVDGLIARFRTKVGRDPAMVVIDTLAKNFGSGNENQQQDMGAFFAGCHRFRETFHCQVVVIHHHNKQGGPRGNTVALADVDTALELTREPDAMNVELRVTKQKDGEQGGRLDLQLRIEQNSLVIASASVLGKTPPPAKKLFTAGQAKIFKDFGAAGGPLDMAGWQDRGAALNHGEPFSPALYKQTRDIARDAGFLDLLPGNTYELTAKGKQYLWEQYGA